MLQDNESRLKSAICRYLDTREDFIYSVTNASGSRNRKGRWLNKIERVKEGWPDISGSLMGKFVGIECKTKGGLISEKQMELFDRLEMDGALMIVAYRVEDVVNAFLSYEKGIKQW